MTVFTKELRQQIIEDFAHRNGGKYDAALFLEEVKAQGKTHPAYAWFQWDKSAAAYQYNLWEARAFSQGLKINFEIQEFKRAGKLRITHAEMPLVISPLAGRNDGGGYHIVNPDDPTHVAELCHQGAQSLRSWLKRYSACLAHAGTTSEAFESVARALEKVGGREAA